MNKGGKKGEVLDRVGEGSSLTENVILSKDLKKVEELTM